jgi:hypothetical protein
MGTPKLFLDSVANDSTGAVAENNANRSASIHREDRASDYHPFVERVWRCHSDRADFLSFAVNNFEMTLTR